MGNTYKKSIVKNQDDPVKNNKKKLLEYMQEIKKIREEISRYIESHYGGYYNYNYISEVSGLHNFFNCHDSSLTLTRIRFLMTRNNPRFDNLINNYNDIMLKINSLGVYLDGTNDDDNNIKKDLENYERIRKRLDSVSSEEKIFIHDEEQKRQIEIEKKNKIDKDNEEKLMRKIEEHIITKLKYGYDKEILNILKTEKSCVETYPTDHASNSIVRRLSIEFSKYLYGRHYYKDFSKSVNMDSIDCKKKLIELFNKIILEYKKKDDEKRYNDILKILKDKVKENPDRYDNIAQNINTKINEYFHNVKKHKNVNDNYIPTLESDELNNYISTLVLDNSISTLEFTELNNYIKNIYNLHNNKTGGDILYKEKYLKYKQKYLELKQQNI